MTSLLVDFHHADLFESHHLVFADRFGWDVYAPYGMEWFDEEVWNFERQAHGDAVARQYLLGIWRDAQPDANGVVRIADSVHLGRTITGLTLEVARDLRPDVVMSTVPTNAVGFSRLAKDAGATFGIHIGNQWGDEAWATEPAFAIVTTTSPIPPKVPHVIVHQEFSMEDFRYEPPEGFGPIRSFVNCFPEMKTEYAGNFLPQARGYPEFDWEVYGAYGTAEDDEFKAGDIHGTAIIGDLMRGAGVVWHAKYWSDGFGHVIHNAFAVGRPVFGYAGYYADKLAGPLWVDGVTSYDVQRRSKEEVARLLRQLRDEPDRHLAMCEAAAARFREVVSFEEDAAKIAVLLDTVRSRVAA